MIDFFFDTADDVYVRELWSRLKGNFDPKHVRGITTNPNAFKKMNMFRLSEWETQLTKLCKVVSDIREDDLGVVYVQAPISKMTPEEVLRWAKHISRFSDGVTKLGLKIPPFKPLLEIVDQLNKYMEVNVTGVSDCSTALNCFSYPVKYVSMIPGRMEEKGIDAKSHVQFVNQRMSVGRGQDMITGSMRTIEGLRWVSEYGTVPTIGSRVWDLIFDEMGVEEFAALEYKDQDSWIKFSPHISDTNTQLSVDFFEQMDECGVGVFDQFFDQASR